MPIYYTWAITDEHNALQCECLELFTFPLKTHYLLRSSAEHGAQHDLSMPMSLATGLQLFLPNALGSVYNYEFTSFM